MFDKEGGYYQTQGETNLYPTNHGSAISVGATTILKLTKLLADNPQTPLRNHVQVVYRDKDGKLKLSKDEFYVPFTEWGNIVAAVNDPTETLGSDTLPTGDAFAKIARKQADYRQMLTRVLRN